MQRWADYLPAQSPDTAPDGLQVRCAGAANGTTPHSAALLAAQTTVLDEAHDIDDRIGVRRARSVFLPAGLWMAGSALPAIVNLPAVAAKIPINIVKSMG